MEFADFNRPHHFTPSFQCPTVEGAVTRLLKPPDQALLMHM